LVWFSIPPQKKKKKKKKKKKERGSGSKKEGMDGSFKVDLSFSFVLGEEGEDGFPIMRFFFPIPNKQTPKKNPFCAFFSFW
jgi:hypothetical protein